MPTKDDLRSLRLAYRLRRYLLRIKDVLGYGVGYRIRDGVRTDEPALVVYVCEGLKERDPERTPRHRRIPRSVVVQSRSGRRQLPVDLVEGCPARLCAPLVTAGETICNCMVTNDFGTVGWIARQADGTPVFCSCYHVLLPLRFPPGNVEQRFRHDPAHPEKVTTPSVRFGGNAEEIKGVVVRGVRTRSADVAIAQVQGGVQLQPVISGIGPLRRARALRSGEVVPGQGEAVKVAVGHGAAIPGVLLEYPSTFTVRYPDFPEYRMENLIATSAPVRGGDSGALLLDGNDQPLGMLIGVDEVSGRSYFTHISTVMTAFNLREF